MSGQPKVSRADIARYFALLQPPLITEHLFNDVSFRAEFGLTSRDAIAFGGGPAILKAALYDGVRKMFAEQRPQALTALTGDTITVTHSGDYVALSFPADGGANTTVHSLNLMLLSASADIRLGALQHIVNELGPTGPDPNYWRKELPQRALDDERMDHFLCEIDASIVPNMARVGRDTMAGVLDKTHIVPRSAAYWKALCGPPPSAIDQETWLKDVFEPHRRCLIERDLARGLDLCLAMGIRDDVTARSLITHVSRDELWAAFERLRPIDDPFSLLGVAELAVGHAGDDERFAALAAETIERLCGEQLRRSDGLDIYAFLPALVDLVLAELRVLPSIAACPAYWRRICAWTQAALLIRAFQTIRFDPEQFSENLKTLHDADAEMAELLDLRQSPLSLPSETIGLCVRAEILGRLAILQKRETDLGRELPGSNALTEALAAQAKSAPLLSQMPGPLELDRLPFHEFENLPEGFETFRADLQLRADELTNDIEDENWARFFYLSRLFRFGDSILDQITKLTASVQFGTIDDERRAGLIHMDRLSYVALSQRHVPLAEAILLRCLQRIGIWTDGRHAGALVHIGFIATAAWGHEAKIKERFAKYLRELAFVLPQGAPCQELRAELDVLKTFTPPSEWHNFAQAEALCLLGT